MDIKISNFKMPVTTPVSALKTMVMNRYRLSGSEVADFRILRASIDARKKSNVEYELQEVNNKLGALRKAIEIAEKL